MVSNDDNNFPLMPSSSSQSSLPPSPSSLSNPERTTSVSEKTEIWHGEEIGMNRLIEFMSRVKSKADVCGDSFSPSFFMRVEQIKKRYMDFKKGDVKVRFITEVTKDNINYCKELMEYVEELRHMDGVKGNMVVTETEYVDVAALKESKLVTQIIYSNTQTLIEQNRYFFDNLWNKALPAKQKIKEIEEGIEPEFFEVITDHEKASQVLIDLARSVKKEALFFLPNNKAMVRIDRLGVIDYLIKVAQDHTSTSTIKIICPLSEVNYKIAKRISEKASNIRILNGNNSSYSMYIADSEKFASAELREPNAEKFSEAIGFALYSNRKITVDLFKSFFELLWNERVLNEELKTHDKIQKEFINIAAHELKTPTQAVLGFSKILKQHPEVGREDIIQAIHRNATRLQELTENILDVSRIESQTLKLNKERFNLNELISNIAEDYRSQINNADVQLIYKSEKTSDDNTPIYVEADKVRLTQVISNFLSNAFKFTKEGVISIITEKKDDQVIFSIKDTGTGIAEELYPRLFTKFVSKSQTGTGLGLFISKNIIEAQSGRVWAENNPDGKGATFFFTLPLSM
jgi:two-component system, OmpR family, sensor histidine kinase VicK